MRWLGWLSGDDEKDTLVPSAERQPAQRDHSYETFTTTATGSPPGTPGSACTVENNYISLRARSPAFDYHDHKKGLKPGQNKGPNRKSRALNKDGSRPFSPINVYHRRRKFVSDIFTTLLELKWRFIFLFCFITYFGSWLFFAGIWYLIVYLHGDLDHINDTGSWRPCVTNIGGFASIFLFSVETQHTIGYGLHSVQDHCFSAIMLLCLQSIVGVILEGFVVGLFFLKISKAKKRSETLAFSKKSVICQNDEGKRFFMFRICDTRTSLLLNARIRAYFIRKEVNNQGDLTYHTQRKLPLIVDGETDGHILLFWPTTVIHEITPESPLFNVKPDELHSENSDFEILCVLEGTLETTGSMTQARTSYAPEEIDWGSRFRTIRYRSENGHKILDYSIFDETVPGTTSIY